jgi:bla regulator protein blaR1
MILRSRAVCYFCVFSVLWRIASLVSAQAPATPTFEVASVKQNKAGPDSIRRVGIQPGDRVTLTNVTLRTLIQVAYPGMSEIIGGPKWIGSAGPSFDADRFDVNAKAAAPASRDQLQTMLRSLLTDRFKLTVHTETRQAPIYALVLARRDGRLGPSLHPATADCPTLRAQATQSPGDADPCGQRSFANALITGRMSVRGFSLDTLGLLRGDVGRPVENNTGLTGMFDWDLTWTPQVFLQRTFDHDRFPTIDPDGPAIFTALEEQLGLKLESQKAGEPVLVIDRVEHPTED